MVGILPSGEIHALLIELGGVPMRMTRRRPGDFDPVAQSSQHALVVTQTCVGVLLPSTPMGDSANGYDTLTTVHRRKVFLSSLDPDREPLTFAPDNGYSIEFENAVWTIDGLSTVGTDGNPVLFMGLATR